MSSDLKVVAQCGTSEPRPTTNLDVVHQDAVAIALASSNFVVLKQDFCFEEPASTNFAVQEPLTIVTVCVPFSVRNYDAQVTGLSPWGGKAWNSSHHRGSADKVADYYTPELAAWSSIFSAKTSSPWLGTNTISSATG